MRGRIVTSTLTIVLSLLVITGVLAQEGSLPDRFQGRALPDKIAGLKLDVPLSVSWADPAVLQPSLAQATGNQQVIIRLVNPPVAQQNLQGLAAEEVTHNLESEQADLIGQVLALDPNARVLGQTQLVLNAVFADLDASVLSQVAANPAVARIARIGEYEMDLSETVPYIGAAAVQAAGYDGTGVRVAVLDSGVDYYHAALGGSGDPAEYAADDPTMIEPGTFPTAKVVGGYDYVGSNWFGSGGPPEAPDPDPLDDGPGAGHGTHVAHIIGGYNGVAPGVEIYAVKVCSSISTACSGIALIQGMEFAVDPNGDGDPEDGVDIINMSLGADYGQPFDDDLAAAVDNATALGVLTVASAGNGGDKPFVNGTPASAATALSVAQTQVPSAALQLFTVAGVDYPAVFQLWSAPLTGAIGPVSVVYGGDFGSALGCSTGADPNSVDPADAPYPPGTFSGEIVLVDRGTCNFSIKIFNIQRGGGSAGIIGLVAPGAPFAGSFGAGGPYTIPGYMISQADSNAIKAALPADGTIDPANQLPLVGQMVGSSSRGPQHEDTTQIKPEIGAPGASVSAIAGSGTGEGPFGGTSGAAPMVTGSAALLIQARGDALIEEDGDDDDDDDDDGDDERGDGLSPLEIKALLMNTGETAIDTDPFTGLAPITRIGGGEVRVDRALSAPVAAWENGGSSGALSFGFIDVTDDDEELSKWVRVRNYSDQTIEYDIIPTFRYEDDALSEAIQVDVPESIAVWPGDDRVFEIELTIDGTRLPDNFMNSGSMGAGGDALTANEFDGYLILSPRRGSDQDVHLAWHVLPRRAAEVEADTMEIEGGGFPEIIELENEGVGTAQNDAYSLLAVSENIPEGGRGEQSPTPDIRAVGINTFPVEAGFCSADESFVWAFAINSWERQGHLVPVKYFVYLDIDQDGVDDFAVFNNDASVFSTGSLGTISDGRQLTLALDLAAGSVSALFFAEHSTNTGNTILYICGEQVGLTGTDMLVTSVNATVEAFDFYYGGPGDVVTGLTITPLGEQYFGVANDLPGHTEDEVGLSVFDFGPFSGNSAELGLMLITNGDRGPGFRGGATHETEALLFTLDD